MEELNVYAQPPKQSRRLKSKQQKKTAIFLSKEESTQVLKVSLTLINFWKWKMSLRVKKLDKANIE